LSTNLAIASGNDPVRPPVRDCLDREAHARLAPVAQREGRLSIVSHLLIRVVQRHRFAKMRQLGEQRTNRVLRAEQQEVHVGMPLQCDFSTFHDHARSPVAAHCIKGDRDAFAHLAALCTEVSALGGLRSRRGHFTPIVVAARFAQMMRALQLAAIRAFGISRGFQRMMRSPHVAARGRSLLFWDGH
jgi:hypothetical protein